MTDHSLTSFIDLNVLSYKGNRDLTMLGRERQPRLCRTKTAITEIKAVNLCINDNLKDLL